MCEFAFAGGPRRQRTSSVNISSAIESFFCSQLRAFLRALLPLCGMRAGPFTSVQGRLCGRQGGEMFCSLPTTLPLCHAKDAWHSGTWWATVIRPAEAGLAPRNSSVPPLCVPSRSGIYETLNRMQESGFGLKLSTDRSRPTHPLSQPHGLAEQVPQVLRTCRDDKGLRVC